MCEQGDRGPCDDCQPLGCVVDDDNDCSADEDCSLSGYGCRDGHCVPVALCATDSDCAAGFCYRGRTGGSLSQGVCVELGSDCGPYPGPCSNCQVCLWGEWQCVGDAFYPALQPCPAP